MKMPCARAAVTQRTVLFVLAATACLLTLLGAAQARGQTGQTGGQGGQSGTTFTASGVSATLEQCVTSVLQSERSATFSGEMTAVSGTARMSMRVDVEERAPGELSFHTVTAPGLGVWRVSDAKVKVYKYLKQVTNLASPAVYRAMVHFRWLSSKGHVIKRAERLTPRCAQLAMPTSPTPSSPESVFSNPAALPGAS